MRGCLPVRRHRRGGSRHGARHRHPEPGGLTARQLLDAVRRCCLELPVVGVDVVEVSPPYDHADITAYLGNRVVLEALSAIARRRGGEPWDPRQPLLDGR
nr:arginase family protein [Phytohabitans suffuscus]